MSNIPGTTAGSSVRYCATDKSPHLYNTREGENSTEVQETQSRKSRIPSYASLERAAVEDDAAIPPYMPMQVK